MKPTTPLAVAVALATAAALTACGITEGTVTDKDHDDGYYQTRCHTVVVAPARGTTPARTRQDCRQEWVPRDRWSFELRNSEGDTGTVTVTRTEYDAYDVGDHYPN